jgi:hypothetical protein
MAMRANQTLEQALSYKKQVEDFQAHFAGDADVRVGAGQSESQQSLGEPAQEAESVAGGAMRFIKGKLVAVDCSGAPQAVLIIRWAAKSMKFHIHDSAHLVLIGADDFSCNWTNKNVAINYRERTDGEGDVVSLEVQ